MLVAGSVAWTGESQRLTEKDGGSDSTLKRRSGGDGRHRTHLLFWSVWGVLFLIAFGFGAAGYYRYLYPADPGPDYSAFRHFLTSLYLSLQLFVLETGYGDEFVTRPAGWPLELGRWLAALVSSGTIAYALAALLRRQIRDFRLRRMARHTIICGLGDWSVELAREIRSTGGRVAIIEKDPADEWIPACRARGIPVVVGDATDEAVLVRVGIGGARSVVAFCDEDGTNASIAQAARRALIGFAGRVRYDLRRPSSRRGREGGVSPYCIQ